MISKPRGRRTVDLHLHLLPSAMTVLSLCAGLTSIKFALDHKPIPAMALIAVQHRPGRFGSADLAAASTENERTSLRIRTDSGAEIVAVQIAGLLARRIVCDARVGDKLSIGGTYGLIRFGSRLDTYLPPGSEPLVQVGQRAVAGETVLAELP